MRAPIYKEYDEPLTGRLKQLRATLKSLDGLSPPKDLMDKIWAAVIDLEEASKAVIPIKKGHCTVGYGVSKSDKAITCDAVMSIVRVIKSSKGW